jgi:hypothetical protein
MLLLCRTCSEYDDVYEEAGEEEEARDEEGEEGDDNVIDIDRPEDGSAGHAVAVEDRMTTPYMTKYERARILGTRALQIRCADRLGYAPAADPARLCSLLRTCAASSAALRSS